MSKSATPVFMHDGLPVLATASTPKDFDPYSKTKDELDAELREAYVANVKIYVLNKPEELAKYTELRQAVANGLIEIQREDVRWVESEKTWHVLIICRSVYLTR